ncbi:hypothetical protein [Candidatus Contubernalis alkaliaceticus]|uniref:hypothetical protein n=1 Tax=Candidatus Contubernalis alkaliaceticus TaxID=338645 RepID=UPI001F4C07A5|nr:hypothetical protein [Candidatus Contubernalis alkalaceticus]UNC92172.1 hypothetical protein HUE98_08745 [Candidatus Contubernalis alkalaceticus]
MEKSLPYIIPLFRSALFIIGGLFFAAITNQSLDESTKWWPVLCIVFNVITILVLVLVCKYEGSDYRDLIQYKKGQLNFKNLLIIIILMMSIGVGGMYVFGLAIYGHVLTILIQPIPIWIAIINIILLPVTIVFAELPLYYGYSFNKIEENTGNKFLAMSYIIFFYALQHSFIPLLFDWKYILFRFLSFLPLMIVLGIIYNKNRALTPLMIGHGFLDLATGIQILISSLFPAIFEIMQHSVST